MTTTLVIKLENLAKSAEAHVDADVKAFVPKLKAAGASDQVLHRIMVDNPRRFLAFVPKRPRKK